MPRVENNGCCYYMADTIMGPEMMLRSDAEIEEMTGGNGSSIWDLCMECWEELRHDPCAFNDILVPYNGDEINETGVGPDPCEHPPYDDESWGDVYECEVCSARLTAEDDWPPGEW